MRLSFQSWMVASSASLAVVLTASISLWESSEAFAPSLLASNSPRRAAASWGTPDVETSTRTRGVPSSTALGVSMTPDLFLFENYKNEQKERNNKRKPMTQALSEAFMSSAAPAMETGAAAVSTTPAGSSNNGQTQPPSNGQQEPPSGGDLMPEQGPDGIFHIANQEQHAHFMTSEHAANQIVVLKCFAPWCRACKGLEPKFLKLTKDPTYNDVAPMQWADLSIQHNKAFVKSLGVLALPTIQFYVAGQLVDTFACGPSKVPLLKKKLAALINQHVDAETGQLKAEYLQQQQADAQAAAAPQETTPSATTTGSKMTEQEKAYFQHIPYFRELDLADQDELLDNKAQLVTFEPGSVIMREGEPGRTFYVIQEGAVEVCQSVQSYSNDPLVATPGASYLGTVINRLHAGDYFGERALITGEPRAASIRAAAGEKPVTAWVLDKADFPFSSVLSGRTKVTEDKMMSVDDKYGLTALNAEDWQASSAGDLVAATAKASQVRGSANTPAIIKGVDTEDEVVEEMAEVEVPSPAPAGNDAILSLLSRFQLIRHVSRCFDYIVQTRASWGEEGIRKRRLMLVNRLSAAQRAEFKEAFELIDTSGDGFIELIELKRVMESVGETKSDEELAEMIAGAGSGAGVGLGLVGQDYRGRNLDARAVISKQDFLGIMAEAEFFHLFRDTFAALDKEDSGYVRARDLDRVLSGVRDLISDDRNSIIDVEDKDMLVDYEQFSRMLLGSALT